MFHHLPSRFSRLVRTGVAYILEYFFHYLAKKLLISREAFVTFPGDLCSFFGGNYPVPSFSSKPGHVTVKHVLTGRKHDKLGNQTFEVLAVKTNGKYDTFHIVHVLVE